MSCVYDEEFDYDDDYVIYCPECDSPMFRMNWKEWECENEDCKWVYEMTENDIKDELENNRGCNACGCYQFPKCIPHCKYI